MPRFHCPLPLHAGLTLELPAGAARHVQVLRLQPGMDITLFNGDGGEYTATITRMGRSDVTVVIGPHHTRQCEPERRVHLAVGMPANERMDWLVEKATELGVASIQPLHTAHSVLRLKGERAEKKQAHWQALAVAACEQCGGNRVPEVQGVDDLSHWLSQPPADGASGTAATAPARCVLSLAEGTQALTDWLRQLPPQQAVWFLSGPEGGLSPAEDELARREGCVPVHLGPRVLRSETAALTALALALHIAR